MLSTQGGRRVAGAAALVLVAGLALPACSLHFTKHGVSGNIMGHNFSGAAGQLPAGFPSDVPVPDHSRVLGGGGADKNWDVAFAVTGPLGAGTSAYAAKFRSAGYTVSNVEAGSTGGTAPGSDGPTTTVTVTGSTFTAKDATWTVEVATGSSSSTGGVVHAGEFAANITVAPATSG